MQNKMKSTRRKITLPVVLRTTCLAGISNHWSSSRQRHGAVNVIDSYNIIIHFIVQRVLFLDLFSSASFKKKKYSHRQSAYLHVNVQFVFKIGWWEECFTLCCKKILLSFGNSTPSFACCVHVTTSVCVLFACRFYRR